MVFLMKELLYFKKFVVEICDHNIVRQYTKKSETQKCSYCIGLDRMLKTDHANTALTHSKYLKIFALPNKHGLFYRPVRVSEEYVNVKYKI